MWGESHRQSWPWWGRHLIFPDAQEHQQVDTEVGMVNSRSRAGKLRWAHHAYKVKR